MEIEKSVSGGSAVVCLKGKLSFKDHPAFNKLVAELQEEARNVNFDLSGLEMIDSAGIGMLFLAHKLITKSGGDMTISNPKGQVRRVFDITSIDRQLKVLAGGE